MGPFAESATLYEPLNVLYIGSGDGFILSIALDTGKPTGANGWTYKTGV